MCISIAAYTFIFFGFMQTLRTIATHSGLPDLPYLTYYLIIGVGDTLDPRYLTKLARAHYGSTCSDFPVSLLSLLGGVDRVAVATS